ncbi:MAG: hypothetical protein ACI8QC_000238 [Planctomycetota bacterium]|jgi:hypothetical protein
MDLSSEAQARLTRRAFLNGSGRALGAGALAASMAQQGLALGSPDGGLLGSMHHRPRAKSMIHLFMSGAPSQLETWDYKPGLRDLYDTDLPESVIRGQRFTTMSSGQSRFPVAPSVFDFKQHGECGTYVSELLPWTAKIVDKLALVKSVHTDAINHDPAITFMVTGHEQPGRPSLGAWLSYGLGSPNSELPAFVTMTPTWTGRSEAQALYQRLWGAGFLPTKHQGVPLRSAGDAVLYLSDPPGVDRPLRRRMLDRLANLNAQRQEVEGDPEIGARTDQYEMAYRMQASVPDLLDLSDEPESVLALYGPDVKKRGTFAYSCLLARRMVERGVPLVQLFIRGWDQHGNLTGDLPNACRDIDQPSYGLITDLEQRGLLDETLVVWGGEFGRTVYCQGPLSHKNYGRDHHPRCFPMWFAGGGVKGGTVHGETDDFSYNIVRDPVSVYDVNATILHLFGVDHERLTFRFQGRDFRLTDVEGKVVREILA